MRLFLPCLIAVAACKGKDVTVAEPDEDLAVTYYRDIAPILDANCVQCHAADGIGPFVLDTFDGATTAAPLVGTVVAERVMPPYLADASGDCQTFQEHRQLSAEDVAMVAAWIEAGTPAGDPADRPAVEVPSATSITVSETLQLPSYTPSGEDDYRCFPMALPFTDTQFLTGMEVVPGSPSVVHHVVGFRPTTPIMYGAALQMDSAATDGPGYPCFGAAEVEAVPVLTWTPGTQATVYPEGTGIPLIGGNGLILQVHYNTVSGVLEDQSAVNLQLADAVDEPAEIRLLHSFGISLPPGSESARYVSHTYTDGFNQTDFTVHGVYPHMHNYGAHLRMDHVADDARTCMVDVPRYDFGWQEFFWYEKPLAVSMTEALEVVCDYDTTDASEAVQWGLGTSEEMCLVGAYVTYGTHADAVSPQEGGWSEPNEPAQVIGAQPTLEWTTAITGGDLPIYPTTMAIGPDGAIAVVLQTYSPTVEIDGGVVQENKGSSDAFVAVFDADGTYRYGVEVSSNGHDYAQYVAFDDTGTLWATGSAAGPTIAAGAFEVASNGGYDAWFVEVAPDGSVRDLQVVGGSGDDRGLGLAHSPSGGVRWAVHTQGLDLATGPVGGTGDTLLVVAEDADGVQEWTFETTASFLTGYSLVGTADGGVVVGGSLDGDIDLAGQTTANDDGYALRLDGSGQLQWAMVLPDDGSGVVYRTAVDGADTLLGVVFEHGLTLGSDTYEDVSGRASAVARIDASGGVTWSTAFLGQVDEDLRSIWMDGDQVVAGLRFDDELLFEGHAWRSRGQDDVAIVSLDAATGAVVWARQLGDVASTTFPRGAATSDGTVVAYNLQGTSDIGDGPRTSAGERYDVVVAKFKD